MRLSALDTMKYIYPIENLKVPTLLTLASHNLSEEEFQYLNQSDFEGYVSEYLSASMYAESGEFTVPHSDRLPSLTTTLWMYFDIYKNSLFDDLKEIVNGQYF